jgi:hypothetical protein
MSKTVEKHIYTQTGFSYKVDVTLGNYRINESFSSLDQAIKARDAFLFKVIRNAN